MYINKEGQTMNYKNKTILLKLAKLCKKNIDDMLHEILVSYINNQNISFNENDDKEVIYDEVDDEEQAELDAMLNSMTDDDKEVVLSLSYDEWNNISIQEFDEKIKGVIK